MADVIREFILAKFVLMAAAAILLLVAGLARLRHRGVGPLPIALFLGAGLCILDAQPDRADVAGDAGGGPADAMTAPMTAAGRPGITDKVDPRTADIAVQTGTFA